jgi:hypothetical protein
MHKRRHNSTLIPHQTPDLPTDTSGRKGAVRMPSHRSERPLGTAEQSVQSGFEPQCTCLFLSDPHRKQHREIRCQYSEARITMTAPVLLGAHTLTTLTAALFTSSSQTQSFLEYVPARLCLRQGELTNCKAETFTLPHCPKSPELLHRPGPLVHHIVAKISKHIRPPSPPPQLPLFYDHSKMVSWRTSPKVRWRRGEHRPK